MVNRLDAATDALMALTGATFASGRIEVSPCPGPLRFRFGFQGEVLELRETERTALAIDHPGKLATEAFDEAGSIADAPGAEPAP